ncbi:TVP38/TMEM64 family protein [Desulfosporosinus fructosivorans]|uniref:TVP38/TMEM64 family membrane protein n=1 Tax=Desulfosporosinus fructosivorans TaxID=2018669 RepID=A0A4Z0R2M8_9FIRM|nr:VTT domain-containing protein [Desulfosporosinus fructosivorans]TGE36247.1 TVP38/TMEM64 family protein [Desulfosporosinus fructosivorans]
MTKKHFSFITLLISLAIVVFLYPKLQNPTALKAFVSQWGLLSIFIDLVIVMILALFPVIPFVLMAGINTILYGWIGGFLLSLCGSLLGASLGFWLARTLGQAWAQPKMSKLGKWGTLLRGNSFSVVLLSRLIPVLPSAAVNYAAGLSLMTFPSFLMATLLGKIPMIVWESWVGHDLWRISHHPRRLLLALAIGVLVFGSVGLYWYFTKKFPKEPRLL